eukprot:1785921-Ditylum_brightwellii.AAC.1
MPFELEDLLHAKHCINGRYRQARINMVIDNGRQYLISWVNQSRNDTLVPRYHMRGTSNAPLLGTKEPTLTQTEDKMRQIKLVGIRLSTKLR